MRTSGALGTPPGLITSGSRIRTAGKLNRFMAACRAAVAALQIGQAPRAAPGEQMTAAAAARAKACLGRGVVPKPTMLTFKNAHNFHAGDYIRGEAPRLGEKAQKRRPEAAQEGEGRDQDRPQMQEPRFQI